MLALVAYFAVKGESKRNGRRQDGSFRQDELIYKRSQACQLISFIPLQRTQVPY